VTPVELLLRAIEGGLTVALEGDRIAVRPREQLSDELRRGIVEQREAVVEALQARTSMPAILAPIPPRPCDDCAQLQAGVFCLHYQMNIPEPARLARCVRFQERVPDIPWTA
jgi:hypothetical protein